jgi:dephospho-CoA kinase
MLVIGLTGGIGTGKSEAARHMVALGAKLIDADVVGHEAYRPHAEAWRKVVEAFGDGILGPDNEIDRRSLGAIVFSDPDQLARLNGIMHPLMAGMVQEKIDTHREEGAEAVVVEAALLFEAGWNSLVQEVWVTDSPLDLVVQRLAQRNGMGEEEARRRISSQMSRQERLERADFVIDNSTDVESMQKAIEELWSTRVKERIEQT